MLTLLKFSASWCGPCKSMDPVVDKLNEEDDELILTRIDVDENPQERINYNVRSIPTFVLVKDGKEVARKTGQATISEMKSWVEESHAKKDS